MSDNGAPDREALAAAISDALSKAEPLLPLGNLSRRQAVDVIMPLVEAYGDERAAAEYDRIFDSAVATGKRMALDEARAKIEALNAAHVHYGCKMNVLAALGGDDA